MQSLKTNMGNLYLRYKLRILAQSALSTGVENDAIEEEDVIDDYAWLTGELLCIVSVHASLSSSLSTLSELTSPKVQD